MSLLLRRAVTKLAQNYQPVLGRIVGLRSFAKPTSSDVNSDEPVQFFGSQAAAWRAKQSRGGNDEDRLWYQPYVVSGCTAIFLIYFLALREENDIDRKLERSLFDHVEGLEEQQLIVVYNYNKENGIPVRDIEERLMALGIDVKTLNAKN